MGLTTWAAFSGSDELAAVDGDFIMTAEEVQPVLLALRKANRGELTNLIRRELDRRPDLPSLARTAQ